MNRGSATCATKRTDALAVGTCGVVGIVRVLVSVARLHPLDVLGGLNLRFPNQRTSIHRLTTIDVPRVLLLEQFGNLTCVHSITLFEKKNILNYFYYFLVKDG